MSPPAAESSMPFDFANSIALLITSFQMSLPFLRLVLIDTRYPFVATRQLAWLKSVVLVPLPVASLIVFRIPDFPFLSSATLLSVICPSRQKLRARSTCQCTVSTCKMRKSKTNTAAAESARPMVAFPGGPSGVMTLAPRVALMWDANVWMTKGPKKIFFRLIYKMHSEYW